MNAFRNVMLVGRQLRWLSSQVALCVAGMGQCASLKVKNKNETRCYHSKSDCTGLRKLVV